jgi:hypothetical protein
MKRIIALALVLVLALAIGCAAKPSQKSIIPAGKTSAQSAAVTAADVTDVDTSLGDIESLDDSLDPELDSLDEGLNLNI